MSKTETTLTEMLCWLDNRLSWLFYKQSCGDYSDKEESNILDSIRDKLRKENGEAKCPKKQ